MKKYEGRKIMTDDIFFANVLISTILQYNLKILNMWTNEGKGKAEIILS